MAEGAYKLLLLTILEILRKHSDEDHHMKQVEILTLLEKDYGIHAVRSSIRRNLDDLKNAGFPVESHTDGWYYEHEFSKSEIDMLIDCVMSYGGTPIQHRKALLDKVAALGGDWYEPSIYTDQLKPTNSTFIYSLDMIHEAIRQKKRILFQYGNYGTDKMLHPRLSAKGSEPKYYDVTPYRIITTNGRYYLVCNVQKYSGIAHFRIDRMLDIRITQSRAKAMSKVEGLENGLEPAEYIVQHPYMYSGDVKTYRIHASLEAINDILDWFGMNTEFENEDATKQTVDAIVRSEAKSMEFWAKRYDYEISGYEVISDPSEGA